MFVGPGGGQGIFDGAALVAPVLDAGKGGVAEGLVFNQVEIIHLGVEFGQKAACSEKFEEDDVAHAKAEGGEVCLSAADEFDEVVVTAAAGNGAEFAFFVEGLKNHAGVVGQPADDVIINFDKSRRGRARFKIIDNEFQFGGWLLRRDELIDFIERETERGEGLGAFLRGFALQFVNNLVKGAGIFRLGAAGLEKLLPGVAAAEADDKILRGQTAGAQGNQSGAPEVRIRQPGRLRR